MIHAVFQPEVGNTGQLILNPLALGKKFLTIHKVSSCISPNIFWEWIFTLSSYHLKKRIAMQKMQFVKTFFMPLAEGKEMWYDRKNEQEEKLGFVR